MVSAPLFSFCGLGTLVVYKGFAFSSSLPHYLIQNVSWSTAISELLVSDKNNVPEFEEKFVSVWYVDPKEPIRDLQNDPIGVP